MITTKTTTSLDPVGPENFPTNRDLRTSAQQEQARSKIPAKNVQPESLVDESTNSDPNKLPGIGHFQSHVLDIDGTKAVIVPSAQSIREALLASPALGISRDTLLFDSTTLESSSDILHYQLGFCDPENNLIASFEVLAQSQLKSQEEREGIFKSSGWNGIAERTKAFDVETFEMDGELVNITSSKVAMGDIKTEKDGSISCTFSYSIEYTDPGRSDKPITCTHNYKYFLDPKTGKFSFIDIMAHARDDLKDKEFFASFAKEFVSNQALLDTSNSRIKN